MVLKQAALDKKENDKKHSPESTLVIFEDTEASLISPKSDINKMYYHTKLNLHNVSFFNCKNKKVLNYLWDETQAGLTAHVFATIHLDYLSKQLEQNPQVKEVIAHSNGCVYQNKNAPLANGVRRLAVKHGIVITWKYLEVGHTFMECDSYHRLVEDKLKTTNINIPADYVNVIKTARKKPEPYEVRFDNPLPYTFFKNYDEHQDLQSIRL